jgi:iron complex outermembrane recepter protein
MKTRNTPCRHGCLPLLSFVALAGPVIAPASWAQSAPSRSDPPDETIVLSPFVVDSSSDQGYYATNTLAGTRLRSNLRDVAAPISVFTEDLLRDIAATNFQEAMLYSVNVENEDEYAPDDTEGESISSTVQNRVRGISGATQTRGYFKTNFRADSYNTERLTVARGPNSILFGLGSPSGVLDATPAQANPERFSGEFAVRVDNHESLRTSADFNIPVWKNVAALRVAALDQKLKTDVEPEYDDERRYYLAATVKPFEGTTIRASYEDMKNDRVRARSILMEDRISDWIALGKPLYDHTTGLWTKDNGATWSAMPQLSPGFINTGGIGYQDRVYLAGGHAGGNELQGLIWSNTGLSFDRNKVPRRTFVDNSLVPTDVNYHGVASKSRLEGDIGTVVLEQKLAEDLFLELGYNRETYSRDQDDPIRQGLAAIEADVNFTLPYPVGQTTGQRVLNPNRGRYLIESEYLGYTQEIELKTFRAMLSYTLDFAKHERPWLGQHTFGLMYQDEVTDNFKIKRRLMNTGAYWIGDDDDFNLNNVKSRYYLDIPGLGGDPAGVKYPGEFVRPPWDTVIGGLQGDGMPQQTRNDVEGKLFVLQSQLLNKSLVLTFGYRDDTQKAYTSTFTERDPVTREYITDGVGFNDDPNVQSGITRTYGAVYHTPLEWLSLTYNRSDAFNPQGDYFDWFGNPLPPGSGKGEDFGVNLVMFGGKLNARLNRFENTSIDNVEFDWYYEEPKWSVVGNMDASWGMVSVYADRLGNTGDINIVEVNDSIRATRDYESKGYEAELFYKPTDRLDLRFTLTKTEARNLRVVPLLQAYIAARLPVWEKYFAYPAWRQWDEVLPQPDPNWATNPDSTGYGLLNSLGALPRVEEFKSSEGSVTTRGRKWRSNLIANYRFGGALEGFSLGGGARWRSPDTIGYHGKPNPLNPSGPQVGDITRPIKGDDELLFDAWLGYTRELEIANKRVAWTVQLNVRNLWGADEFTPIAAYTDGTYTAYDRNEPRTFILTNTLRF